MVPSKTIREGDYVLLRGKVTASATMASRLRGASRIVPGQAFSEG